MVLFFFAGCVYTEYYENVLYVFLESLLFSLYWLLATDYWLLLPLLDSPRDLA
jgi:hypothetical protein